MKFKLRNWSSKSIDARNSLARHLTAILEASPYPGSSRPYVPYNPTENETWEFVLDSGNDWRLKFFKDQPDMFEITQRYNCAAVPAEAAFGGWIQYRLGAKIVPEEAVWQGDLV